MRFGGFVSLQLGGGGWAYPLCVLGVGGPVVVAATTDDGGEGGGGRLGKERSRD